MNILLNYLPEEIEVNGQVLPVNFDFRAGIEFELMADRGESNIYKLVRPFFPKLQTDIATAFDTALWFFRCGQEPEEGESTHKEKGYSFDFDADVIFADFWRYYNIDLSREMLHWWAFRALLTGLPSDSEFKTRIYYRTCDLKGLPKAEKDRINRIRKQIALTPTKKKMTLEERNAEMKAYVERRQRECRGGEE